MENENSIRNQFHLALVGVPVIEVEIKQKLQRIDSGMPKPSLLNLSSPVDKQVKNYVSKPPKHLEKARKPMEELLEKYPGLLGFLESRLPYLKFHSDSFNEDLIAAQKKLSQALEESRTSLLNAHESEESEVETQELDSNSATPPDAASSSAAAALPRRPSKRKN